MELITSSCHGRTSRPLPPLDTLSARQAAARCDNERSLDTRERKMKGNRVSRSFQSNCSYANLSTKHSVQQNGMSLQFTIDCLSLNSCSRPFPHPCEQTNTSSSSRLLSVKKKKPVSGLHLPASPPIRSLTIPISRPVGGKYVQPTGMWPPFDARSHSPNSPSRPLPLPFRAD